MSNGTAGAHNALARLITKFPSFLGVGAIGFIVDACFFFGLTLAFGVAYGWARIVASLVALTVTWLLNRASTFADGRIHTAPVEFLRYLMASSAGAAANLAALSWVAQYDQALRHAPAYIVGAAVGLAVNFLLYDRFVFQGRAAGSTAAPLPPKDNP